MKQWDSTSRVRGRETLNERENQWTWRQIDDRVLKSWIFKCRKIFFSLSLSFSLSFFMTQETCLTLSETHYSRPRHPLLEFQVQGITCRSSQEKKPRERDSSFETDASGRKLIEVREGFVKQLIDYLFHQLFKFQQNLFLPIHKYIYIFTNWKWTKEGIFKRGFSNNCHIFKGKKVMNDEFFQTYYFTRNVRVYSPTFFSQHFHWNLSSLEKAFSQEWNSCERQMLVNMEQHPVTSILSMESGLHTLCHPHNCEHHKLRWK